MLFVHMANNAYVPYEFVVMWDWLWLSAIDYGPNLFALESQSMFPYFKIRSIKFKDVIIIDLLCHDN
jgi:hypothetical protein